ncbi:hypothetical protein N865_16940 [Intrasporangium oryzae NRRL B-24470]|uniref:Bacteriocin-protection protein n=1 Tax=Intrasporangium oryzae NRRL B-24470 TaxID=1386089 RepID=W9GB33_9MICO|nr:YdeI/OmpD-associated family protein [Intrasporangium oryzae]EWT03416.1 hypothetical protein N865_16940 [Intrasporangium oryzae NRRL B-24470]
MREGGSAERPATFFEDAAEFRAWLEANHATAPELWVGLHRSHVVPRGPVVRELVTEALCFGWIDSLQQGIDADSARLRFTPRRPGSVWSRVNIDTVERLTAEGRMHPAGLAAYERRRQDDLGLYSYERDEEAWPADFEEVLRADPMASAFWDGAAASYRKTCVYWVLSAKRPETRERRMRQLVDACRELRLVGPLAGGGEPAWLRRLRSRLS